MRNFRKMVFLTLLLLSGPLLTAQLGNQKMNQRSTNGKKLTGVNLEAKNATSGSCRSIDGKRLALPTLKRQLRDIEVYLNNTNAYVSINGKKSYFNIPENRVDKPGRNWRYHINDIKSIPAKNRFAYKKGKFYLTIEFEGEGREYKGLCPGCLKRFRDSRAPDFNWESPRQAKITLTPKPSGGEVYLDVTKVELSGKFEMGGRMDDFLLPMLNGMEIKLRNQMEREFKKLFNDKDIRPQLSKAFDGFVRTNGLKRVNRIYDTNGQLFFCE